MHLYLDMIYDLAYSWQDRTSIFTNGKSVLSSDIIHPIRARDFQDGFCLCIFEGFFLLLYSSALRSAHWRHICILTQTSPPTPCHHTLSYHNSRWVNTRGSRGVSRHQSIAFVEYSCIWKRLWTYQPKLNVAPTQCPLLWALQMLWPPQDHLALGPVWRRESQSRNRAVSTNMEKCILLGWMSQWHMTTWTYS